MAAASNSTPSPERTALILAAHGERQVAQPNRLLMDHAAALARDLTSLTVTCGVLNGEPSLESALETVAKGKAQRLLVYPFFMADGYFVSRVLPERIAESGIAVEPEFLAPLGLDPGLEDVMIADALGVAAERNFDPEATRLLVVGHGSKYGPASAEATRNMAGRLDAKGRFREVDTAFLEEAPFVADALRASQGPVVVSGFFASDGMHSSRDVPEAIKETEANAAYTGPVGASMAVRGLVNAAVSGALAKRA